jgi:3-vinyl bacteriochlorophyllide hydratase
MFTSSVFGRMLGPLDCCPWGGAAGRQPSTLQVADVIERRRARARFLYTAEERRRRDATGWTFVQGVLAPTQFLVFVLSLVLVLRCLATGQGETAATASIVVKTLVLYTIMVTGSLWEKAVFGRYLFAPAFFWEDAVSMLVLALHTAYLLALFTGALDTQQQLLLALTAYATYLANATQFVLKLRAARREQGESASARELTA